jgi:Ca-activated chloride channel homolog
MDGKIKHFNERKMMTKFRTHLLLHVVSARAYLLMLFCAFICFDSIAQSERKLVREGNQMYKNKKYSDAEVNYKKSLDANRDSKPAQFNLGDAYYKQGKYEDAMRQFEALSADKKLDKGKQAQAFHNLGNSYLQSKKYEESINAYKNALKLNPKDNDTRYNLAYAQSMLQQQQQQQQNQQKDNKDQKKDKEKEKQQQQQQDQQKKEDQKQDDQKQAQKRDKISKEDAEKILQALNNDEKNTQKKLTKKDATRISIDKNW